MLTPTLRAIQSLYINPYLPYIEVVSGPVATLFLRACSQVRLPAYEAIETLQALLVLSGFTKQSKVDLKNLDLSVPVTIKLHGAEILWLPTQQEITVFVSEWNRPVVMHFTNLLLQTAQFNGWDILQDRPALHEGLHCA